MAPFGLQAVGLQSVCEWTTDAANSPGEGRTLEFTGPLSGSVNLIMALNWRIIQAELPRRLTLTVRTELFAQSHAYIDLSPLNQPANTIMLPKQGGMAASGQARVLVLVSA